MGMVEEVASQPQLTNNVAVDDNTPDSVGALTFEEQQKLPVFELIGVPFNESQNVIKRHAINAKVLQVCTIFFNMIKELAAEGIAYKVSVCQATANGVKPGTIILGRIIRINVEGGGQTGLFLGLSDDSKVITKAFMMSKADLEKSLLPNNLLN
jgi:hypothetical protein